MKPAKKATLAKVILATGFGFASLTASAAVTVPSYNIEAGKKSQKPTVRRVMVQTGYRLYLLSPTLAVKVFNIYTNNWWTLKLRLAATASWKPS